MKKYTKLDNNQIKSHLFHPTDHEIDPESGAEDIDIPVDDGIVIGCRSYVINKTAPTLLLFHGNGETVSDYGPIAQFYQKEMLNLIIATYRGYGRSNGTPGVEAMLSDSRVIFQYFKKMTMDNGCEELFVMGRSLGSAVAMDLACSFPDEIKGIILESGFADTLPLLENIGVDIGSLDLEEDDGFGNFEKIQTIKKPTLILHGSLDTLIPLYQAERLHSFCGAKKKKFFIIPGADHNTTISAGGSYYFSTIKSFINEVTGAETWRDRRKKYKRARKA